MHDQGIDPASHWKMEAAEEMPKHEVQSGYVPHVLQCDTAGAGLNPHGSPRASSGIRS